MTLRTLAFGLTIGASALIVTGCDNDNRTVAPPVNPPVTTTSAVVTLASSPDDAGAPFSINDGAFAFNDTSDTTDPTPINN